MAGFVFEDALLLAFLWPFLARASALMLARCFSANFLSDFVSVWLQNERKKSFLFFALLNAPFVSPEDVASCGEQGRRAG